jgi:O-antigen/teichoic acid export membrane protein
VTNQTPSNEDLDNIEIIPGGKNQIPEINVAPVDEKKSSYRQIMKATSLFGGVQVFNIIISIIRSKFIAVLLGPTGVGISGLLTSTTGLIGNITNLGLSTSAVKYVAAANSTGDSEKIGRVVSVLRRLVWITGLTGMVFTLTFAPLLSELTFGNRDYTFAFVCISITLLLTQISAGQLVVLQGMRKLKYLAKADIAGVTFALLTSVPIYYVWGLKGIVPAIIISSFMTLFLSWYFSSRVKIETFKVNKDTLLIEGSGMVRMGFFLTLSSLIATGTSYIVRIFISHKGGVDQVGLYNAGFAIINTYVGMVFSAMVTDYFPRLSGIAHDSVKARDIINQQAEVALLILAPILSVFLIFINWIVILFYSTKFVQVDSMIHWAALGIFFKAASWPVAYLIIAKGNTKLFFYNELMVNLYMLGLNLAGYLWMGLEGLGISFFAGYLLYLIQVFVIANRKYSFTFQKTFYKIFSIQFVIGLVCFASIRMFHPPYVYFWGSFLILVSSLYSFRELNKRLKLIPYIMEKLGRK